MKAYALLVVILLTHYGYPDKEASWWFYIFRGIEGTILFLTIYCPTKNAVVSFACIWGALEEASTAVCGFVEMGSQEQGQLCIQAFGPLPYAVIGSALLVYLWGKRARQS